MNVLDAKDDIDRPRFMTEFKIGEVGSVNICKAIDTIKSGKTIHNIK